MILFNYLRKLQVWLLEVTAPGIWYTRTLCSDIKNRAVFQIFKCCSQMELPGSIGKAPHRLHNLQQLLVFMQSKYEIILIFSYKMDRSNLKSNNSPWIQNSCADKLEPLIICWAKCMFNVASFKLAPLEKHDSHAGGVCEGKEWV